MRTISRHGKGRVCFFVCPVQRKFFADKLRFWESVFDKSCLPFLLICPISDEREMREGNE